MFTAKIKRNAALALLGAGLVLTGVSAAAGETAESSAAAGAAEAAIDLPSTESATEAVTELPAGENGVEAVTEASAENAAEEEISLHGIRFAADYKEVYDALKTVWYGRYYYDDVLDYAMEEAAVPTTGTAARENAAVSSAKEAVASTADTGTGAADYSRTNLRDLGVDEADIVKTDGRWIYILREGEQLLIVKADGKDLSLVSRTDVGAEGSILTRQAADMYLDGDLLCIATQEYRYHPDTKDDWYPMTDEYTTLYTFDISDRENPQRLDGMQQDGYYSQSRKIGDIVYLYSYVYPNLSDTFGDSDLIPKVNGAEVPAQSVCIPNVVTDASYLIVSSVNLKDPGNTVDTKVLVSGAGECYVSTNSLYVMNRDYSGTSQRTEIVKFDCTDGKVEGRGACYLRGYVNDTFSIDEHDGMLRVLTTYTGSEYGQILEAISDFLGLGYYDEQRWVRHNALYILDGDLRMISSLKGIAENEEIRSARYFGDTVYFVTFENTDPLFTADLSDPKHPQLVGELKISGFSSYLHPYGEGRLLGIGYEADEETGRVTGLKLSMFDISDPANVTELDRMVLPGITWCPAIEDYKAILVNDQKNLIGFFCDDRYMVFTYDPDAEEGGAFSRALLYDYYEDMLSAAADYNNMRGLFIGQELYLAGADYVIAFNIEDGFRKENLLTWQEETDE